MAYQSSRQNMYNIADRKLSASDCEDQSGQQSIGSQISMERKHKRGQD